LAAAAGQKHHTGDGDGHQQRRLDHGAEQGTPFDPADRQHATGEVAAFEDGAEPVDPVQVDEYPEPGETETDSDRRVPG
jgi:hypothetical protein